ncbi:MAG: aspartate/glutamate racemase family protein [Nitriliruptoraceae bacterium]
MRTLGLLGGMAWPSTAEAYRLLNTEVAARLGGVHSAPLLVWSADFAEVEALQREGAWEQAGALLADAARRLEQAGAEGLLLCTNTMHKVADAIEAATSVPLLHIADTTAAAIRRDGTTRVGLLGTRFTMEEPFLVDRLQGHAIDVLVPPAAARAQVHRVIYDELVHGTVEEASRAVFRSIAAELVDAGAAGIVAGCTEIELLLGPEDIAGGWYPTTHLQVLAAVDWILDDHSAEPTATPRWSR